MAIAGLVLCSQLSAFAQASDSKATCQLRRIASLEMRTEIGGRVTIPVSVNSLEGQMLVDTGGVWTMLASSTADRLVIKRSITPFATLVAGGAVLRETGTVDELKLGDMVGHNIALSIAPDDFIPRSAIGTLASDVLRNYDIELDFAAAKFNVFVPNECPDGPIYWTRGKYARIPFNLDRSGHITIDIVLDGKTISAVVDTGAETSLLDRRDAQRVFGIDDKNPSLTDLHTETINGMRVGKLYRYPFAALDLNGVKVLNPNIVIASTFGSKKGLLTFVLGIETLRRLHMYIAYKEGALYVTPAEE